MCACSAMNDFHELRLDVKKWQPVHALGASPGPRFCHVAAIHDDSMVVFGGYDGSNRLNDFVEFHLGPDLTYNLDIPPSTLVTAPHTHLPTSLGSGVFYAALFLFVFLSYGQLLDHYCTSFSLAHLFIPLCLFNYASSF